jgi:hypothetical protein
MNAGLEDRLELEAMALMRLIMRRQFCFELLNQDADFLRRLLRLFDREIHVLSKRKTREAERLAGLSRKASTAAIRGTG